MTATPPKPTAYDSLAEIYDVWAATAPACELNRPFYVAEYLATTGLVVELGVGTGRVAVEAAKAGKPIIGVDSSREMLARCRERAETKGVLDKLTLIHADFRDFESPEPAALIALPFHSIGHLLTTNEQQKALAHIRTQLAPGGRLLFDHFIFDADLARQINGVARFSAQYEHPQTGRSVLLWNCVNYEFDKQYLTVILWTDELDDAGHVAQRAYRQCQLSWLEPDQTRTLLEHAGFEIEAVYGEFDRAPLAEDSSHQIWSARAP